MRIATLIPPALVREVQGEGRRDARKSVTGHGLGAGRGELLVCVHPVMESYIMDKRPSVATLSLTLQKSETSLEGERESSLID